jgi:putative oxidoreductase
VEFVKFVARRHPSDQFLNLSSQTRALAVPVAHMHSAQGWEKTKTNDVMCARDSYCDNDRRPIDLGYIINLKCERIDECRARRWAMDMFHRIISTHAPCSVFLIRIIVGGTFLVEGIQKFLFVDALGVGRFVKIGIPYPEIMAPFVGVFEIVCGSLLIMGLLTRLAAIPMIINISVAIISTKIPILLGHGFWMFNLPKVGSYGFWSMIHEARTDFAMLLGGIFLLIVGAGYFSIDAILGGCCRSTPDSSASRTDI